MKHSIPPSSKLIQQWMTEIRHVDVSSAYHYAIVQSAQWGADQELNACCEWLSWSHSRHMSDKLRYTRRPKTPSLKEQALAILDAEASDVSSNLSATAVTTIRRALEKLND